MRSHGGAVAAPDTMLTERPYEIRITRNLREKEAIAREALQFIGDGDRVFFDSSTTVYCLGASDLKYTKVPCRDRYPLHSHGAERAHQPARRLPWRRAEKNDRLLYRHIR